MKNNQTKKESASWYVFSADIPGSIDFFMDNVLPVLSDISAKSIIKHVPNNLNKLPVIYGCRIRGFQEVNPNVFNVKYGMSELILASLSASWVVNYYFKDGKTADDMIRIGVLDSKIINNAHKVYGLDRGGDVNPFLVGELAWAYFEDMSFHKIDEMGYPLIDIAQSKVMQTIENCRENGNASNATQTINQVNQLLGNRSELDKLLKKWMQDAIQCNKG